MSEVVPSDPPFGWSDVLALRAIACGLDDSTVPAYLTELSFRLQAVLDASRTVVPAA